MGTTQLLTCYSYFILVGSWVRFVTPKFANMAAEIQDCEGKFRHCHSHIKEYAEEVDFVDGAIDMGSQEAQRAFNLVEGAKQRLQLGKLLWDSFSGYLFSVSKSYG